MKSVRMNIVSKTIWAANDHFRMEPEPDPWDVPPTMNYNKWYIKTKIKGIIHNNIESKILLITDQCIRAIRFVK